jgi:hypothetical protein
MGILDPAPFGCGLPRQDDKTHVNRRANLPRRGREDPLNFEDGTAESIRSISQRGLAAAWARVGSEGLPALDQFHPGTRVHDPKQLASWKVEIAEDQFVFSGAVSRPAGGQSF